MKNTITCPKCNGRNIISIKNDGRPDATIGNNIQTKLTLLSGVVYVNRYICCNCGYTEEWVDNKDIKTLMSSKKVKSIK